MHPDNKCETCKFFFQHYGKDGKRFYTLDCGHCVRLLVKKRRPGDTCPLWEAKKEHSSI